MMSMTAFYFALKCFLLFSLVRSLVKFDALQKHVYFLAILYTACVALLSYVFLVGPQTGADVQKWEYWLGLTFLISALYFWLLTRFDEGILFWILLLAGFGLVLF
jgi:hypothetical protein